MPLRRFEALFEEAGSEFTDPRTFHVIVGCGFAAVLNHATAGKRIGSSPVLHIGEPDPWRRRRKLAMGQWPHLLHLPAIDRKPGFRRDRVRAFLPSKAFAECLTIAEHGLAGECVEGSIERVGQRDGHLAVTVSNGMKFRACGIDVCCGPGPAKTLDPDILPFEAHAGEAGPWRRIVTGEEFLMDGPPHPPHGCVCVYGGGSTGAWCVQEALEAGSEVVWVSRNGFAGAFVESGRNDGLLAEASRRPPGQESVNDIAPSRKFDLTMAQGYELQSASFDASGRVFVAFAPFGNRQWCAGRNRAAGLDRVACDQLVMAIGQDTRGPCSIARIFEPFVPSRPLDPFAHAILAEEPHPRLLGLRSTGGSIRILGAAVDAHPLNELLHANPRLAAERDRYRNYLCAQARPGALIPVMAGDIAEANGWFQRRPNRSLNTASPGQLRRVLAESGRLPESAVDAECEKILAQRRRRRGPFLSLRASWIEDGFLLDYSESGIGGSA